jgi:hypothetical protein
VIKPTVTPFEFRTQRKVPKTGYAYTWSYASTWS